jgi:hypothetical protein
VETYSQTRCQRQLPNVLQTWAMRQSLVPSGGMVGGMIGAIDGAVIGQIVGGQIGGRSMALLHIGCISPPTQRQTQAPSAELRNVVSRTKMHAIRAIV